MELEMAGLEQMFQELQKRDDHVIIIRATRRETGAYEGEFKVTSGLAAEPIQTALLLVKLAAKLIPGEP